MIIPIMLNETKIIFFLVPIISALIIFVYFKKKILKTTLMALVLLGAGTIVGLYYFTFLQHGYSHERAKSIDVYADRILSKTVEKERVENRGLSRLGGPIYWASEIKFGKDPIKFLFGHGIGSTKSSGMVVGHLNLIRKYSGKGIGVTGTSKLLWEVGLIGTILFFLFWTIAFLQAIKTIKLINKKSSKTERYSIVLFGGSVSTLMVMATLFYDTYLFRTAGYSFFSYLSLGIILYYCHEAKLKGNQ
jgi:hypothetical protein